jgi:CheY-like chemotaxis protein
MVNDPQRTVLYVEDYEVNARLMQALFERRPDLRLLVAPNCAAALRCARAHRPDLMLLDLRLPDGHGCELLAQLRALPGLQRVPAVAVSAEALPGHHLHAFDDQWPKPLNLLRVLDELDRWLPAHPDPARHAWPGSPGRAAMPSGSPVR